MTRFAVAVAVAIGFGLATPTAWAGKNKDKGEAEPPAEAPTGPREVRAEADLADAEGVRANVVGVLKRVAPEGVEGATEGTAVVLDDGAVVFLSKEGPPEAWAWMVGSKVRVQGALWTSGQSKSGWSLPWLADAEAPMPADGMPGMGF